MRKPNWDEAIQSGLLDAAGLAIALIVATLIGFTGYQYVVNLLSDNPHPLNIMIAVFLVLWACATVYERFFTTRRG